jgi:hypothetical protein
MVGRKIGLTLYSVDNNTLCLSSRRRTEFYVAGEASATHTYYTGCLNAVHNLLGGEFGAIV